eukprot:686787-Alexandrium_andersonii.AAC.1
MSASLVGSEMCIRDRTWALRPGPLGRGRLPLPSLRRDVGSFVKTGRDPVSYTHLTLPTICSV